MTTIHGDQQSDIVAACLSLSQSASWRYRDGDRQLLQLQLQQSPQQWNFLPDTVEHPKPARRNTVQNTTSQQSSSSRQHQQSPPPPFPDDNNDDNGPAPDEVSFFQDFVAGGMAGSASVVVGHPFDTLKVRVQSGSGGIMSTLKEFGGVSSLFRGMGAPLSAAAAINAIIFSSYGFASKLYDQQITNNMNNEELLLNHDPWQKAITCGSFAGFMQCFIICPMDHIKCRLQVQQGKGAGFKGPLEALRTILKEHGIFRLYQGWWTTFWREVPAFGLYFAAYDAIKDRVNTYFSQRAATAGELTNEIPSATDTLGMGHSHTWLASMIAGGLSGCLTWSMVYPIDVVKTKIQTSPLKTPLSELRMLTVAKAIIQQHGVGHLFRGFGVTILRAFPTNATIFPVYELTLLTLKRWQAGSDD